MPRHLLENTTRHNQCPRSESCGRFVCLSQYPPRLFQRRPRSFRKWRNSVDIRDLQRQKGVRRVLNQLRAFHVGNQDRSRKRLVNLFHQSDGTITVRSDDDPIWMH
jgi:hypothetical protein